MEKCLSPPIWRIFINVHFAVLKATYHHVVVIRVTTGQRCVGVSLRMRSDAPWWRLWTQTVCDVGGVSRFSHAVAALIVWSEL